MLVVGYGEDNGRPYWILKNSWGTSWGAFGYLYLIGRGNKCGIADFASAPAY